MGLCPMPANLLVPLNCRRAFHQVHALNHGVEAVLSAHLQHGALHVPLSLQCVEIREQIELTISVVRLGVIGGNAQSSHEQAMIDLLLKRFCERVQDEMLAVRAHAQLHSGVAAFRQRSAIEVYG